MKTKKFGKRLGLNKKTIANLNNGEKGHVFGGGPETNATGDICLATCTCPPTIFICTDRPTCAYTCALTCPETCNTCPSACSAAGYCC